MAGGKETPRQKMIGMMYLVLTALLALNVSAEVLQAFNNITRGIVTTISATDAKNQDNLTRFKKRVDDSGGDETAQMCWDKVQVATKLTSDLYAEIEKIKKEVVEAEGTQEYDGGEESYLGSGMEKLVEQKNTDVSSRMLAENNPNYNYGEKLKTMINDTKNKLVDLFRDLPGMGEAEVAAIANSITLEAKDDPDQKQAAKRKWEYYTFNNIPVGATLAVLTKIQNDVKNAETEVINALYGQISAGKIEIEDFVPIVKARKSAVAVGETYKAEIFLSAKVGAITPTITVDGKEVEDMQGATGIYEQVAGSQGSVKKPVKISIKNAKTGKTKEYETTMEYDVFKAPANVSADKMNVVYVGLDNPISISVPGFEPDKISASLSPGNVGDLVKTGPGKYVAKIKTRSREGCKINVSVKLPDGSSKNMGYGEFRTMKVPSPNASLNGNQGPNISAGALKAVRIVSVTLDNFVFEGIRYEVTNFDYIYRPQRGQLIRGSARGKQIPNDLKAAFDNAKRGDLLIINGIQASAPGLGKVDIAGSLVFNVN